MSQISETSRPQSQSPERLGGAFWSGQKLCTNSSVIEGFNKDNVDVNGYRLRMGSYYFVTSDESQSTAQKKTILKDNESLIIPAGQFAFLITKEVVKVPSDAMAFISMSTGIKFQGLINVSGFHVDPGYCGQLIYAVFNASPSPIQISQNDPIFKIWFADLDRSSEPPFVYNGVAKNDIGSELVRGMSKQTHSLPSLSTRIQDIEIRLAEIKPSIDFLAFVFRAIILGVIVAAILALLQIFWPSPDGFLSDTLHWLRSLLN